MTLSPSQAADSLKEIEKTARRSAQAHGYANASPSFILWGVIWMIGYAGTDYSLHHRGHFIFSGYLWMALTILGVAGSFAIGRRQHRTRRADEAAAGRTIGLRWLASVLVIYAFAVASFAIMRPATPMAQGAFIPLIVAMFYGLLGVWKGLRFLFAGIAVAALTLGGYFYLHDHFLLWMAAVGGSSLVLVGLWLRKV